jgi:hypothetical protein
LRNGIPAGPKPCIVGFADLQLQKEMTRGRMETQKKEKEES